MPAKFKVGDVFTRYGEAVIFTVEGVEEYSPPGHSNWNRTPVVTYIYTGTLTHRASTYEPLPITLSETTLEDSYKYKPAAVVSSSPAKQLDRRAALALEAEAMLNQAEGATCKITLGSQWKNKETGIPMTVAEKVNNVYICRWRGGHERAYKAQTIIQRYNPVSPSAVTQLPPPSNITKQIIEEESEESIRLWEAKQEEARREAEQVILRARALQEAKEQKLREERERKALEIDKIMHPERYRERVINI